MAKAKIFEWVDQGLDVPLGLLHSVGAAQAVLDGLNFAEAVSTTLHRVWRRSYGADHDQHKALGQRDRALICGDMSQPFQRFTLDMAEAQDWMLGQPPGSLAHEAVHRGECRLPGV
jgi:hypothetical protein